jgi:hypothetical protein
MQTVEERITQDVLVIPFEPKEAQEFKTVLVGSELVIYPAHLKFYEVATPEQQAKWLETWANSPKSKQPSQISDESLRREHLYE